jgi:carboxylesterase type B
MFVPGGNVDLVTSAQVSDFLSLKFGSALAASILAAYPLDSVDLTSPGYQIAAIIADQFFTCPSRRVLAAFESSGSGAVYMWNFAHRPSWINAASPVFAPQVKLRVAHTSEIWFVFGHTPAPAIAFTAAEQQLSALMRAAWVQFATTGTAPWPAWSAASKTFQMFNTSDGGGTRHERNFRGTQCDLWDAITLPAAPGAAPNSNSGIGVGAIIVISVLGAMLAGLIVYYFIIPKRMRCWDPESLKSPAILDADHVAYGEMN